MSIPDDKQVEAWLILGGKIGAVALALWAGVWRGVKWLLMPRLNETLRDSIQKELGAVAVIKAEVSDIGETVLVIKRQSRKLVGHVGDVGEDLEGFMAVAKDNSEWLEELSSLLDHVLGIERRDYRDRRKIEELATRVKERRKDHRRIADDHGDRRLAEQSSQP